MAYKNEYFYYVAKNRQTGLTDVTATIRRNTTEVATGVSLVEVDATKYPGLYRLTLTAAGISGYGGKGSYIITMDSASKPARAEAKAYIHEFDEDDLKTVIDGIETKVDTIDTEVGAIQTDVTSIKGTVEDTNSEVKDGTYGLSNLKTLIDAIQSTVDNISNVTRFSAPIPAQLIRLASGDKRYQVPVRLFDGNGNPEDPDSNQIQLLIKDEAGNARDSYIVGFTAQPHYISRTSAGIYQFEMDIPDDADLEQLKFEFIYVEDSVSNSQVAVSEVVEEVQASGLALETTAQSILTDTADMQPKVDDIQTKINSATYGLAALKTLLDTINANTDGVESTLANATYGLSALRTQLDLKASQTSVNNVQADLTAVKGSGFDTGTDSLKQISDRVFTGGVAH